MNKIRLLLPCLFIAFFSFFSCKKNSENVQPSDVDTGTIVEPKFKIDKNDLKKVVQFQKDSFEISIQSNIDYKTISDVDWLSVEKNHEQDKSFMVWIKENKEDEDREGTITVSAPDTDLKPVSIQIKQKARGAFVEVVQDTVWIPENVLDLTFTVDVATNILLSVGKPAWVTQLKKEENENGVTYFFEASSANQEREGMIQFTGTDDFSKNASVIIKQPKSDYPNINSTTADLFDVSFSPQGARDFSPYHFEITEGSNSTGDTPEVHFDTDLKMYVASFVKEKETYYKLDYENNSDFIDDFKSAFTLEAYFKPTVVQGKSTIIGSMESYGIGLQHYYANDATVFYVTTENNQNKWYDAGTLMPTADTYYHVVVTYDGQKVKYYLDGNLDEEIEMSGDVVLANSGSQWFGFGADANPGDGTDVFTGDIAFAHFYSNVKSASEVADLFQNISGRKSLTEIEDLKEILEQELPDKMQSASPEDKGSLKSLLYKGWALMGNLSTTDQDITDFENEVNQF